MPYQAFQATLDRSPERKQPGKTSMGESSDNRTEGRKGYVDQVYRDC